MAVTFPSKKDSVVRILILSFLGPEASLSAVRDLWGVWGEFYCSTRVALGRVGGQRGSASLPLAFRSELPAACRTLSQMWWLLSRGVCLAERAFTHCGISEGLWK